MKENSEYIQNLDTNGMTLEEKRTLEKALKDRQMENGIERGTSLKETIEGAKKGIYDEIFIPNVMTLVYEIGCCSKCVIKKIDELRKRNVNIHFLEENLDTKNRDNDLLLGALIGEAVYQMAIEQEK